MAFAQPSLSSNMFITLNLYTKVDGFQAGESKQQKTLDPSLNDSQVTPDEASPLGSSEPKRKSTARQRPLLLNYTLKYGDNEINWVEKNCNSLYKSKRIKIEYMLGYSDQKI